MSKSPMSGALREFLAEAEEQLERVTVKLSAQDYKKPDSESIHAIYRELHSLKGNAQLFGFQALAQVAHTLESAIDSARKHNQGLSAELADQIYVGTGLLERMVKAVRDSSEADFSKDVTRLLTQITEIISRGLHGAPMPFGKDNIIPDEKRPLAPSEKGAESKAEVKPEPAPEAKVEIKDAAVEQAASPKPLESEEKAKSPSPQPADAASQETLRVQVTLLDSLMNLVGELVLVRNQVLQKSNSQSDDAEFANLSQRLDVITTELQNEIMKTRMQPIGTILTKFHRLVRDLSRDLNKEINLKLEGTETELDKTLVEAVKDPLTHIIRNSIDHGIETKEERAAKGKNKAGNVAIRAFHEGGQIVIEISDDGRGLQRQKIGNKAIERGLITAENFRKMSDRDICNLIFLPGFSTAEKVSNLSGRGVGMDVVRTNIEKIGGVVDISSVEGGGSTIRMKIPLTLAIVPALLIKTDGQSFAIPQVKLTELVRLQKSENQGENRIEHLQGQAVFRLRGNLLPLVSLESLLGLSPKGPKLVQEREETSIVVLQADAGLFGLIVDEIDDSTDIVVKSLSGFLKDLKVYSGATVLGDGSVALVLDVTGLAEHANIFNERREIAALEDGNLSNRHEEITEFLTVDVGLEGRYCIPLFVVNRLEEFPRDLLEVTGNQLVVRYRDTVLPLIDLAQTLKGSKAPATNNKEFCSVIVVQQGGRLYGIIVEQIMDIIGMTGAIDESVRDNACLLGTKIYQQHIVSVVDAFRVIHTHFPILNTKEKEGQSVRILYAEDNNFFQRQITLMLEGAGFKVTACINGEEAYQSLDNGKFDAYDIVVSDLDMPVMDGFQLVEKIRGNKAMAKLPVVALSSRAKLMTEKQVLKSGFDCYIEKSDVAGLIEAVQHYTLSKREMKRGA
ncbi:MAG: response regulator [Proteobacteria bacterium]|nr:MAG: response regulator [Pseudomonadota bacterium]